MKDWAERECRIACGKENPNFDFDSDDFDYGCSCYKSALKAYKSLMDDGHSGSSFGFTKNILIRLMEGHPLTPIEDKDFFFENSNGICELEPSEYLAKRGLKSSLQCPRMSSLFREETLDGKVTYHDIDRCIMVDVEQPSDTFSSGDDRIIDEMFPITMPYMPKKGRYEIYTQTFLTDRKNGDFDTRALLYVITPDGDRIDLNVYKTDDGKGGWKRITKEEYDALQEKRIDKLSRKVAEHLLWTLIENSTTDEVSRKRREAFNNKPDEVVDSYLETLTELCRFFENPDNYKHNTFSVVQRLCRGDVQGFAPELVKIAEYLKHILSEL
jgi:hypothetical protein